MKSVNRNLETLALNLASESMGTPVGHDYSVVLASIHAAKSLNSSMASSFNAVA